MAPLLRLLLGRAPAVAATAREADIVGPRDFAVTGAAHGGAVPAAGGLAIELPAPVRRPGMRGETFVLPLMAEGKRLDPSR